jgi:hypothetical protein
MVANAKQFNERNSLIFDDAERVRKTASNFMTKHNPAYRDPNYVAQPTPFPEELTNGHAAAGNGTGHTTSVKLTFGKPKKATPTPQPTPQPTKLAVQEENPATVGITEIRDYKGKTFQQAQEQLLDEMIDREE